MKNWGIGLSVAHRGLIVVWLPLGIQLFALFFAGYWLVGEFHALEMHHRNRLLQETVQLNLIHANDLALSTQHFRTTMDNDDLSRMDEDVRKINETVAKLQSDCRDAEAPIARRIEADAGNLVKAAAAARLSSISKLRSSTADPAQFLPQLEKDAHNLNAQLQAAGNEDPAVLKNSSKRVMLLILAMIGADIMLALLMVQWFSHSITSRLRILTDNTFRLARSEALHPRIFGNDEIAHLDRVFHAMANALAEAARKERAVIQHAADVICSIDAAGKFSAISPASFQIWGYSPEELIGRSFTEIVAEEDRESTNRAFMSIASQQGEPQPIENKVIRKNGETIYIRWSAYWAPSEQSMFCVAHDITERKLSEDQLKASESRTRSIFESAPVALLVLDELGTIKMMNPKAEHMFAYRMDELIGRHVSLLLSRSADFDEKNFRHDMLQNMAGRVRELDAYSRTGRVFPIELTIENYLTAEGERFLAAILDVTERHEVERLRRDFVSTVSHELRTPLTAIRGSLTLLAVGALGKMSEQADKAVKIAERNSLRLINLINDLLDIEKLEAGKLEMVIGRVKFAQAVERSIEAVRGFAEQYGITMQVDATDAYVYADEDRLVQVLVNLLSNAIKFSPRDEVIRINATVRGDYLKVSVTDKGRGIPAQQQSRVFERFQQVEAEDAKRKGGTGLGLAICKAIVEQHKGRIGVESGDQSSGSTFWFEIPLARTLSQMYEDHLLKKIPP